MVDKYKFEVAKNSIYEIVPTPEFCYLTSNEIINCIRSGLFIFSDSSIMNKYGKKVATVKLLAEAHNKFESLGKIYV